MFVVLRAAPAALLAQRRAPSPDRSSYTPHAVRTETGMTVSNSTRASEGRSSFAGVGIDVVGRGVAGALLVAVVVINAVVACVEMGFDDGLSVSRCVVLVGAFVVDVVVVVVRAMVVGTEALEVLAVEGAVVVVEDGDVVEVLAVEGVVVVVVVVVGASVVVPLSLVSPSPSSKNTRRSSAKDVAECSMN
jgi:hypothetical protein